MMRDLGSNFVSLSQNSDINVINQSINDGSEVDEDPFASVACEVSEPGFYKLDKVVFAEPIEDTVTFEESDAQPDTGEISFIDNVMVKKRPGRRNKYYFNIKEGSLNCPQTDCTKSFASTTLLKAHVRKVHCATKKCVCEQCGAAFGALYLLRRHYAVHNGQRVQCEQCGLWLSERTSLSAHRRTHTAHRAHECSACRRKFLRAASLRAHCAFVHRDGDIPCGKCDAKFTSRKLWTRHQATHKL